MLTVFDLPGARALIFSLTQGGFPFLGYTQLPVLTCFLFAALQAGCEKGPSGGSLSPQASPRSQSKGTAGVIGNHSRSPHPFLVCNKSSQYWKVFGAGEKHQRNSKRYFKSLNSPNYKTIYNPQIITSYQTQNKPTTLAAEGLWPQNLEISPTVLLTLMFFSRVLRELLNQLSSQHQPTDCLRSAPTPVRKGTAELDGLRAFLLHFNCTWEEIPSKGKHYYLQVITRINIHWLTARV